jgi:hypothetical protein
MERQRHCHWCDELVTIRQIPGGEWIAFDAWTNAPHDCRLTNVTQHSYVTKITDSGVAPRFHGKAATSICPNCGRLIDKRVARTGVLLEYDSGTGGVRHTCCASVDFIADKPGDDTPQPKVATKRIPAPVESISAHRIPVRRAPDVVVGGARRSGLQRYVGVGLIAFLALVSLFLLFMILQ